MKILAKSGLAHIYVRSHLSSFPVLHQGILKNKGTNKGTSFHFVTIPPHDRKTISHGRNGAHVALVFTISHLWNEI